MLVYQRVYVYTCCASMYIYIYAVYVFFVYKCMFLNLCLFLAEGGAICSKFPVEYETICWIRGTVKIWTWTQHVYTYNYLCIYIYIYNIYIYLFIYELPTIYIYIWIITTSLRPHVHDGKKGNPQSELSGWWFGTFFHSVGNVITPTDELIFFRGVGSTTNQNIYHICTRMNTPYVPNICWPCTGTIRIHHHCLLLIHGLLRMILLPFG